MSIRIVCYKYIYMFLYWFSLYMRRAISKGPSIEWRLMLLRSDGSSGRTLVADNLRARLRLSASIRQATTRIQVMALCWNIIYIICIVDTLRVQITQKCWAIMIFSPFSGFLSRLSSVHNLKNKSNLRKINGVHQSSPEEQDRESSPYPKSSSPRTKELKSSETSSEWMCTGHW